jgi:hypothetical protein
VKDGPEPKELKGPRSGRPGDRTAANLSKAPRGPKRFLAFLEGLGVRLKIQDRARRNPQDGNISATIRYDFYFTKTVDMTSTDGINAGFARAVKCGEVGAIGIEDGEASTFVTDPEYKDGFFYCVGVDAELNRSKHTDPVRVTSGVSNDLVPPDPAHFLVSESGETVGDSVVSMLSCTVIAPTPIGSFAGVQLLLEDYPSVGAQTWGPTIRYSGPAGGSATGKLPLVIGKRKGTGTLTISGTSIKATNGSLNLEANAGDYIEVFGVRAQITSVTNHEVATLAAAWTGPTVTNVSDWSLIALVRIYAVSITQSGTRRSDVTNSKYVDVLLDGELSAPNPPSSLTMTSLGKGVRGYFPQVNGTLLKHYNVFRKSGSGATFDSTATLVTTIPHDPNRPTTANQYFEDFNFTITECEQGTVYTYFVQSVNTRSEPSATVTQADATPRLNNTSDVDPTVPSRSNVKNLIYNGAFHGTVGNVSDLDTVQDAHMSVTAAADYAGQPYNGGAGSPTAGAGRYVGYTRWHGTKTAGAPSVPGFGNGNEAWLPQPGAGQACYLHEEIDAWGHATKNRRKIKKGGLYTYQVKIRKTGSPNGSVKLRLEQYDNGVLSGQSPRRYRDAGTDLLAEYTGAAADRTIAAADLTDDWQLFHATYRMDPAFTTKQLRVTIERSDSTAGEVFVSEAMLSEGEEVAQWTPDMGDSTTSHPDLTNPPNPIGDSPGRRPGYWEA